MVHPCILSSNAARWGAESSAIPILRRSADCVRRGPAAALPNKAKLLEVTRAAAGASHTTALRYTRIGDAKWSAAVSKTSRSSLESPTPIAAQNPAGGRSSDQDGLFHKVVSSFQLASATSEDMPLRRGSRRFWWSCRRPSKRFCDGGIGGIALSWLVIVEPISEPIPTVRTSRRYLAEILRASFHYLSVVSQTVSHWLSQLPKPLMHTHLDLEARVGIEPLLELSGLTNLSFRDIKQSHPSVQFVFNRVSRHCKPFT